MPRTFNGTSDFLTLSGGGMSFAGDHSSLMLVKPATVTITPGCYWSALTAANVTVCGLFQENIAFGGAGTLDLGSDANGDAAANMGVTANAWQWIGHSHASGVTTPTLHRGTVGGTWTHTAANLSGTTTFGNDSSTINRITIGKDDKTGGTFKDTDVAVFALWTRNLSNAEIELVSSSMVALLASNPAVLVTFDQDGVAQKVIDLTGHGANESARTGTTVSTASVPSFEYGADGPIIAEQAPKLQRTDLGSWALTGAATTAAFTTGSFTPPPNSLLVISVAMMGNGLATDLGQPSITDNLATHLTYTYRTETHQTASWCIRQNVFTAPVGASPSAMTITVDDDNNESISGYQVTVTAFTGYDTTTPIAGIVTSTTTNIADGAETQTLGATPTADDVVMMFCHLDCDSTPANPTMAAGYVKSYDLGTSGGNGTQWVAHRENSTSTSATVTDVYTATGTVYKASLISLIVKAATTASNVTVGKDLNLNWYLRGFAGKDLTLPWTLRVLSGEDLSLPWTLRVLAGKDLTAPWTMRTLAGEDLNLPWSIRTLVGRSLTAPWTLQVLAGKDLSLPWTIRAAIGRDLTLPWTMRTWSGKDLNLDWYLRGFAGKDLTLKWSIGAANVTVGKDLSLLWTLRTLAGEDLNLPWTMRTLAGKDIVLPWTMRTLAGKDLNVPWTIRVLAGLSRTLPWTVRVLAGEDLVTPWTIRTLAGKDLELDWSLGGLVLAGRSLTVPWTMRTFAGEDLGLNWYVRGFAGRDLILPWTLRTTVGKSETLQWTVRSAAGKDITFQWYLRGFAGKDLGLNWWLQTHIGKDLTTPYTIRTTAGKSLTLPWWVLVAAGQDLTVKWTLLALAGDDLELRWRINEIIGDVYGGSSGRLPQAGLGALIHGRPGILRKGRLK